MALQRTIAFFLPIFALRKPWHVLIKPFFYILAIEASYFATHYWIIGAFQAPLWKHFLVAVIVAAPFSSLGFVFISYLEHLQVTLSKQATTDDLTQLPNRRSLMEQLQTALKSEVSGFFLIIDADHFKRINDTYGHPAGDVCLKEIAQRISSVCRSGDTIGRIGGEEFGALLKDRTMHELERISSRLCYPITISIPEASKPLRVTLSAGATELWAGDELAQVMRRADEALLVAKNNGRERTVVWRKSEMSEQSQAG